MGPRARVLSTLLIFGFAAIAQAQDDICWKQSYGRGAGTIPDTCANGTEKNGLLCYPTCRAGFSGAGPVCWQVCPSGFANTAADCTKPAAYGRGAGYPFKVGDPLNNSGMYKRCEADNGKGNCEEGGAIVYPKCRAGFHKVGCCVCSPDCPAGMTDIGAGCQKQSYGRTAGTSMSCRSGLQNNAGLCYTPCRTGTTGVGPVCWNGCSKDFPVNCGASCAKTVQACAQSIVTQVQSTGELALNVALLVTSGGAGNEAMKAAQTTAEQSGKSIMSAEARQAFKSTLKQKLEQSVAHQRVKNVKDNLDNAQSIVSSPGNAGTLDNFLEAAATAKQNGQIDVNVLADMQDVDPTGIMAVINAFNRPICGQTDPLSVNLTIPLPQVANQVPGIPSPQGSGAAPRTRAPRVSTATPQNAAPSPAPAPGASAVPDGVPQNGVPQGRSAAENMQICKSLVQGKIAWDANGTKTWNEVNLNQLCQGSTRPAQPPRCFNRVMHGNVNWGGSTVWQWNNALALCAGSNNGDQTVVCFEGVLEQTGSWQAAIDRCKRK